MDNWNSDKAFGFAGAAGGGATSTAPTPRATATSTLSPHPNAIGALLDPKGSPVFWLALAAVLGLAMVSGQLKVSAALKARGGAKQLEVGSLARIVLLVLVLAYLVNVARGTGNRWLRAKFFGTAA